MASSASSFRAPTLGAALLVALAATSAHAKEPLRLSLVRDDAARACPDASEVEALVRARLRRDPFAGPMKSHAEVALGGEPSRLRARIRIVEDGVLVGERTLESDACAPLADATALALALYVDPNAALTPPTPSPPAPAPPQPREAPLPPQERTTLAPKADRSASLVASGLFVSGALPRAAEGAAVTGALTVGPLVTAEIFGWLLPEVRPSDRRFGFGLAGGGARGCVDVVRTRSVLFGPCAGIFVGEIHAVVYEQLPTEPGGRAFAATLGDARAMLRLVGPLVVSARAGAFVPLVRNRFFVIGEADTVFHQPALALAGELGLGVSIP